MAKVTVLGSGGWGMALSMVAEANGHEVTIWTPFAEEAENLLKNHGNERLLPEITFPEKEEVEEWVKTVQSATSVPTRRS